MNEQTPENCLFLADNFAAATGGASVLSADAESPVMAQTAMMANLLQALQIHTQASANVVGQNVRRGTVDAVLLTIQKPVRHSVLSGLSESLHQLFNLVLVQLSSAFANINTGLFGAQDGITLSNTGDGGKGERHGRVTVQVRVVHTKNVQKLVLLDNKSLAKGKEQVRTRKRWKKSAREKMKSDLDCHTAL